jgi:sporulation protein YqfC
MKARGKRSERKTLRERVCDGIGMPGDVLNGGDLCEVRGRRELTVSGCRRILQYGPDRVTLQMKRYVLTVEGRMLRCLTFCGSCVGIDGEIVRICFDGGEDER